MIKYKGNFQIIINNDIYVEILRDLRFTDVKVNNAVTKLLKQINVPNELNRIVLEQLINVEYTYDDNEKVLIFDIEVN